MKNKVNITESKIHYMDEYRPHVVVPGEVVIHIFQLRTLQQIAQRKLKVSEVDDFDDVMPSIVGEWLNLKGEQYED